jgi:hypothetical protein
MPLWAIILFILSFFWSLGFIANRVKQAATNAGMTTRKARNIQFGILGFYFAYLAYISILSVKGVFYNNSLPPTVMVFGGFPVMVILFGIIGNTKLFKKLLRSITLESLITMHMFRFVGVFFIILYSYHLLPTEFAFSAGMGDIITALLAFPVARMVLKGKSWNIKAVYAWNIFGILDILTLLVIAVLDVKHDIVTGGNGDREMTIFPFVWFPAFAPATILFLHTVIFRKLIQIKKQTPINPGQPDIHEPANRNNKKGKNFAA